MGTLTIAVMSIVTAASHGRHHSMIPIHIVQNRAVPGVQAASAALACCAGSGCGAQAAAVLMELGIVVQRADGDRSCCAEREPGACAWAGERLHPLLEAVQTRREPKRRDTGGRHARTAPSGGTGAFGVQLSPVSAPECGPPPLA